VITLGPSFAVLFDRGEVFVGLLVTAFGVGSIVAAPMLPGLRRRIGPVRTGLAGMLALVVGLLVLAAAPVPAVAFVGAFVAGFAFMVGTTELTTTRGRVMALWTMGFFGSRPLAALLNGSLADLVSARLAVVVLASLLLGTTVYGWRRLRALGLGENDPI